MKKILQVMALLLIVIISLLIISSFVIKNNFNKVLILIQDDMSKGKYNEALAKLESYNLIEGNSKNYMI
jgi:uncharacterized protein YxeA